MDVQAFNKQLSSTPKDHKVVKVRFDPSAQEKIGKTVRYLENRITVLRRDKQKSGRRYSLEELTKALRILKEK